MADRKQLLLQSNRFESIEGIQISWIAHAVWASDVNLQSAFDLRDYRQRRAFLTWMTVEGLESFGLDATLLPDIDQDVRLLSVAKGRLVRLAKPLVRGLINLLPEKAEEKVRPHLRQLYLNNAGAKSLNEKNLSKHDDGERRAHGLNFVGYAKSNLGLGEHLRTMVQAYASQKEAIAVLDSSGKSENDQSDNRIDRYINPNPLFEKSHVVSAPEQMLRVLGAHGLGVFTDHPLIATWAWELERMPNHWEAIAKMVDRFWVASPFIANSLKRITDVPIDVIPPAVLPGKPSAKGRPSFGIAEEQFTFLAHFDCRSYLGRKNPFAVVQAFRKAFPGTQDVKLILKSMNIDRSSDGWKTLMKMTAEDDRIQVIEGTLSRADMLALMCSCNAYVSLHRSEGFGFGPAEAMYFGKPTIVTDYSATRDFCDEETAFPVRYDMVPVPAGSYPHHIIDGEQQHWADASVDHASEIMQLVLEDQRRAETIGKAGRERIRSQYSAEAIGRRMVASLEAM